MIKSYMVVDRNERYNGKNIISVCEVEDVEMDSALRKENPNSIECFLADIPEFLFSKNGITPIEQEIYSVLHEGTKIYDVFPLSNEEKENW